jgi:hypothetical protein
MGARAVLTWINVSTQGARASDVENSLAEVFPSAGRNFIGEAEIEQFAGRARGARLPMFRQLPWI